MRYALLAVPLLPLALAACLTGGRLDHAATGGIALPAVSMPGREWRISAIDQNGSVQSVRVVRTLDVPRIHVHAQGGWSVGTLGVLTVAPQVPRHWVYNIEPVTD